MDKRMTYAEQVTAQALMLTALDELEIIQRRGYQPTSEELLKLLDVTTKFYPTVQQKPVVSQEVIEKARQFGLLINDVGGF